MTKTLKPHELLKKGTYLTQNEFEDLTKNYRTISKKEYILYYTKQDKIGEHYLMLKKEEGLYKIVMSEYYKV